MSTQSKTVPPVRQPRVGLETSRPSDTPGDGAPLGERPVHGAGTGAVVAAIASLAVTCVPASIASVVAPSRSDPLGLVLFTGLLLAAGSALIGWVSGRLAARATRPAYGSLIGAAVPAVIALVSAGVIAYLDTLNFFAFQTHRDTYLGIAFHLVAPGLFAGAAASIVGRGAERGGFQIRLSDVLFVMFLIALVFGWHSYVFR